jgi:hypothetical protein
VQTSELTDHHIDDSSGDILKPFIHGFESMTLEKEVKYTIL